MSNLVKILSSALDEQALETLSQQVGLDKEKTASAVSTAMPLLIDALSRQAKDNSGAEALAGALDSKHDGSVLEDVVGYLSKGDFSDGSKILGHVLGDKLPVVESGIGKASGLDASSASKVVSALAPLLLGALGKQKREQGLDAGALASFLGQEKESAFQIDPDRLGILGQILDADHDGDLSDDLLNIGGKLLSGFLQR